MQKEAYYPSNATPLQGWALLFFLLLIFTERLHAQTFPSNFAGVQLATGLDPVALDVAPDGRLFITEKTGKIRLVKNGALLSTPFLTIPNVDNFNERGLVGITLDPAFATNGYVYVYYTYKPGNNNRISRFTANGDVANASSELVLLNIDPLSSSGVHNGGGLFFKEGKLYITVGDNANSSNAQSLSTLKGKVLRINPNGSIPSDNPFYGTLSGNLRAIWALGLRNPFKATVQSGTGKIFINDVGAGSFEEINEGIAGKNYGWPTIEGYKTTQTPPANYQDPFYAYDHSKGCSITGGDFYNPSTNQFPSQYVGKYFFADYCNGWIKTIDPANGNLITFATGINRPLDIQVGNDGALYFIARGGKSGGSVDDNTSSNNGVVWKVNYTGNGKPIIAVQPTNKTALIGTSAVFSVNASGTPTPTYQWQRNQVNIAGATAATYTLTNVGTNDNGAKFRVIVSNSEGSVTSSEATLTVTNNQKPVATIVTPATGATYSGGDNLVFSGTGTDAEDGNLPASAFAWKIDLYHYDDPAHYHPALEEITGVTSGSFSVPTSGETSPNVLFRVYLTVTDSQGSQSTTTVDVNPLRSNLTFLTNPAGLELTLDGKSVKAPYSVTSVRGIERFVGAVLPPALQAFYDFYAWSDGGEKTHLIVTPATNQTYTATYIRKASTPANPVSGFDYQYFEGTYDNLPNFSTLTPVKTGRSATIDLSVASRTDNFALQFKGYVNVPTDGKYTFYTTSDDGSQLYIGTELIVNNDGLHGAQEAAGSLYLKAGKHPMGVNFFQKGGDKVLLVSYEGPGITKQLIPATALSTGSTVTVSETIYEAEEALLSGVQKSTLHSGYTGTAFGDYSNASNDYIEWTVNAPVAGNYTLGFRYGLGSPTSRPLEIKVNGSVVAASLAFPSTTTFPNWSYVNLTASLPVGTSKVRATAIGSSGANVDHLKVSYNAGGRIASSVEESSTALRVYPNPTKEVLYIEAGEDLEESRISLTNLLGKAVTVQTSKVGNVATVKLSHLPAGVYLLSVIHHGKVVNSKIIVE